jgi:hypothetical protein
VEKLKPVKLGKNNLSHSESTTYSSTCSDTTDSCSYSIEAIPLTHVRPALKFKCRALIEGFKGHCYTPSSETETRAKSTVSVTLQGQTRSYDCVDEKRAAVQDVLSLVLQQPNVSHRARYRMCGIEKADPRRTTLTWRDDSHEESPLDGLAAGEHAQQPCCHEEVRRIVNRICFNANDARKAAIVDIVARECMQPPGLTEEEVADRVLSVWNDLL